ncbi:MAG: ribbon-helix-helix protein, CopG family [Geminicoccaceae bacterium]
MQFLIAINNPFCYTLFPFCVAIYEINHMSHALNIRDIGASLNAALDARAAEEGLSKSELVRRLLAEAVQPPRRQLGAGRCLINSGIESALEKMRVSPGGESAWHDVKEPGVDPLAGS